MLLAEELALVAIDPRSGRHGVGTRDQLNACLAGTLVAELLLEGHAAPGDRDGRIVPVESRPRADAPTLAGAALVVAEKGPRLKAVLSHMSRGLQQHAGMSTWDGVTSGLVDAGILGPADDGVASRRPLLDAAARDAVVARLRAAAASDAPMDRRTAVLLSMTGPAQLLELVAPDRSTRKHARRRIDHALDGSELHAVGKAVRRLVQDAAAGAG
ncbi:MAG TPA: GPP34 family phosphoprotein [Acidimicrobiales bacterium]|nr:GPP34 family phosphoprotein [Acidimicrobiales bacterium]